MPIKLGSRSDRILSPIGFGASGLLNSMLHVDWKGGMAFEAHPESGFSFHMDAYPDSGGQNLGPTPLEAFQSSLAACAAMDVISILHKKQQIVHSYRIEVEGTRPPSGQYPRPFLSLKVTHVLSGENLDPEAIKRAIELSDEKYCSVSATIRTAPPITSDFRIE